MKITHTVEVTNERIQDLLCNALEGGCTSLYIKRKVYPEGETKESLGMEYPKLELPFKGGSVIFYAPEDEDDKEYTLDYAAIERGLTIMADKYPRHMTDFLDENDDAITGDVFLQCCLLGEIVYG